MSPLLRTHIAENVRILCGKVRRRMKLERRRKRELEIVSSTAGADLLSDLPGLTRLWQSAPFSFKHENTVLPGISNNE